MHHVRIGWNNFAIWIYVFMKRVFGPTEDTLVRQKRIQVATCQPEGLADFRRCIAEAAVAVQLVEFFTDDAVCLVEHLIVLDTEVHSDYSCLFHLSLFV